MSEELRIGEWIVRPASMEIEPHGGEGEGARLTPKAMAVLCHLASQPGQVVSREALIEHAWDEAFVSDDAVSTVIYELRRAFQDKGNDPRYIETIRKGGYRLIADVEPWAEKASSPVVTPLESTEQRPVESAPSLTAPSPTAPSPTAPSPTRASLPLEREATARIKPPRPKGLRRMAVLLTFAVVLVALLVWATVSLFQTVGYLQLEAEGEAGESDPAIAVESLAVLPINMVDLEGQQDVLADALTEMLIADLAQICPQEISPGLAVRGQDWDLESAAQHLAVDAVVEGTLVRSGDRLWLSIQLVDVQTGQMLWGGSFEREVDDLASLRSLAQDIALRLQLEVAPPVPGLSLPQEVPVLEVTTDGFES